MRVFEEGPSRLPFVIVPCIRLNHAGFRGALVKVQRVLPGGPLVIDLRKRGPSPSCASLCALGRMDGAAGTHDGSLGLAVVCVWELMVERNVDSQRR